MVKNIVWKNIDMSMMKLGISREKINLVVRSEEVGNVDLKKLIDSSMLIMSDSNSEPNIDVFLTTRNN